MEKNPKLMNPLFKIQFEKKTDFGKNPFLDAFVKIIHFEKNKNKIHIWKRIHVKNPI